MSWLDVMVEEQLKNLPSDAFSDRSGGFDDIAHVIAVLEKAIERNTVDTADAMRAAAAKASADPFHDLVKNPVFAPAGAKLRKAAMVFPRILRSSLFIAIYSHLEHLLLSWCESLCEDLTLPKTFANGPRTEAYPHRYLRYIRDEAKFDIGDFDQWAEWQPVDAYRRARNCLAHNGGIVRRSEDRNRIRLLPHVQIDESCLQFGEPLVHLLPGACEAAVQAAKALIERLLGVRDRDPRTTAAP